MRSLADWLERQQKSHPSAIDLTLARVREVARRLELLDARVPASSPWPAPTARARPSPVSMPCCARSACARVVSPRRTCARYNERICVDGVEATDAELIASFERIDAVRGDITLTFFEYNALAALDLFRARGVEVAVLEVGLGGRLDATNIVDADVGVVCSIGLDHVDWLGGTLEEIGREKAGIFRAGRPAVLGERRPAAVGRGGRGRGRAPSRSRPAAITT